MSGLPETAKIIAQKIEASFPLSEEEREAILSLPLTIRRFERGRDLARHGDKPTQCMLLLDGWIGRYKVLDSGKRQIVAIAIPGDMPDLQSIHLPVMDHDLGMLTKGVVAFVPHSAMTATLMAHPGLARAFWRDTLVEGSISREWVLNVAVRSAYARVGHVLCELFFRARAVGLTQGNSFEFPLSQATLGEVAGLSNVHVNRTLMALRADNLIAVERGKFRLIDIERMKQASEFDDTYLHLPAAA